MRWQRLQRTPTRAMWLQAATCAWLQRSTAQLVHLPAACQQSGGVSITACQRSAAARALGPQTVTSVTHARVQRPHYGQSKEAKAFMIPCYPHTAQSCGMHQWCCKAPNPWGWLLACCLLASAAAIMMPHNIPIKSTMPDLTTDIRASAAGGCGNRTCRTCLCVRRPTARQIRFAAATSWVRR